MPLYSWIIANKELVKLLYTVVALMICLIIVMKTDKLFRLSLHQGIRYFRNAFVFYGFAFIARYFFGMRYFYIENGGIYYSALKIAFEFFLIMASFFLFYSLLWKRFEKTEANVSSLLNARIFIFYILAIIIAILDYVWHTYNFIFLSQIILFSFVSGAALVKLEDSKGKSGFLRLYLVVIMLNLVVWVMNFMVASFFGWYEGGLMSVYSLNIIIFLLFLYAVNKATKG